MRTPLTELGRQLEAPDARLREQASRALAELDDGDASVLLRAALQDEDARVRVWASRGLARKARADDAGPLRCALVDEDPEVRLWAAIGLARAGDRGAAAQLVVALEEGPTEVRTHASQALHSFPDGGPWEGHLVRLFETGTPLAQTWAAAVLAGRGSAGALAFWRRALRNPGTRVDAALAAPLLRSPLAARDLVTLAARLPQGELRAAVCGAGSLAELLTAPLLALGFEALLEDLEDEPELRRDLYLVLGRAPGMHRPVREAVLGVLRNLAPAEVGRELAEVLGTLPAREAAGVLGMIATVLPDSVVAAVHALPPARRDALFAALHEHELQAFPGVAALLGELLRTRRDSHDAGAIPHGGSASRPGAHTNDAARSERVAGRLLAPELATRGDARSPAAEEVLARARVLGLLVARGLLEERIAPRDGPDMDARGEVRQLLAQLAHPAVERALLPTERDMLELSPGSWDVQDRAEASACAEALAVLLWALGGVEHGASAPPMEARALLERLDAVAPSAVRLRGAGVLLEVHAQCEAWSLRVEQEALEREARAGRTLEPLRTPVLRDALAAVSEESARSGRSPLVAEDLAEALRLAGLGTVERLLAEGRAVALVDGDLAFGGVAIAALDDAVLARARDVLHARVAALHWLTYGGQWPLGAA